MCKKLLIVSLSGIQDYIRMSRKISDLKISSIRAAKAISFLKSRTEQFLTKNCAEVKLLMGEAKETGNDKQEQNMTVSWRDEDFADRSIPDFFIFSFCSDSKAADIEAGLGKFLKGSFRGISDHSEQAEMMPEDISFYLAVCNWEGSGENDGYEEAYRKVQRRLRAKKNDRMSEVSFRADPSECEAEIKEIVGTKKIRRGICVLCGKRKGYTCAGEEVQGKLTEYLCPTCRKKRAAGEALRDFKELSTKMVAEEGASSDETGKYYTLIQADLDDMGKYMSGEMKDRGERTLREYQEDLIWQINEYQKNVKDGLGKLLGKTHIIYCGGDDLLFFCPVHKVWDALKKIHDARKQAFQQSRITCSVNVTIVHWREPMKHIVKTSNEQLAGVKEHYRSEGKGGLGLTLSYGGSFSRTVYLKGEECQDELSRLINDFQCGKLSRSLIYSLEEELCGFGNNMSYEEYELLEPILRSEIRRITARKCTDANEGALVSRLLDPFIVRVRNGFCIDFEAYFNLLHIAEKWAQCRRERRRV